MKMESISKLETRKQNYELNSKSILIQGTKLEAF